MLTNRSAPPATVTPVLIYPDVRAAVDWLESAFGFGERVRIGEDHRAQLRVGTDGAVVVADVHGAQVAPEGGVITHLIKVRVEDVDAAFAQARDAGGGILEEPTTHVRLALVRRRRPRRPPVGADPDSPRRRTRRVGRRQCRALVRRAACAVR